MLLGVVKMKRPIKVLTIEDDPNIVELIQFYSVNVPQLHVRL